MAKRIIRTGTTADPTGDSLKNAFVKVNDNFTELYNALGLDADLLNLGAFEFTGSVMTTTDSSAIVIDQATTITSNLSVGGDIVPQTANGGDLGSSTLPWRSLYVSNNTIYIGGTAVGLDANGNLTTGGTVVGSTPAWANITGKPTFATVATTGAYADLTGKPTIPTLVSQLANDSGFLTSVGNISNIQSESDVSIQVNLTDSTTRIWRFGEDGDLTLPSTSGFIDRLYTDNGGSRTKLEKKIESSPTAGTIAKLELDLDNGHIRLAIGNYTGGNDQWIDTSTWAFRGDTGSLTLPPAGKIINNNKEWIFGTTGTLTLPTGGVIADAASYIKLTPAGGANEYQALLIYPTAADGNHIHLAAPYGGTTELYLGNDLQYVKLVNGGNIEVRANNGVNSAAWTFGTDGALTIPGDIKSDGNINIDINLADSTLRRWQFGEDGNLTFPDGTNYSGKGITLPQTLNGTANKVSWNFSDLMIGNSTTFLEWNLLSTDLSEFLIGTTNTATPFYFSFDGSGQTLGTIDNGGIFGGGKLTFGSTAGNNAGDANAIELKATNGDVYLTSTESVKITVDANDSSARVWTFDPSGNLNVPGGIVAEYEEDFTITTSYLALGSPPGPVTNTLTFAANGDLTVPDLILGTTNLTLRAAAGYTTSIEAGVGGTIEIGYQGDPPTNIYIGTATTGYTTTVRIASDRIRISADVPASSKGQSGDIIGLVAFSSTHIYYCTASYDGTTDIWNRVALTGGVW